MFRNKSNSAPFINSHFFNAGKLYRDYHLHDVASYENKVSVESMPDTGSVSPPLRKWRRSGDQNSGGSQNDPEPPGFAALTCSGGSNKVTSD